MLLKCRPKQNFFFDSRKLTEYLASAIILASSSSCFGPSPRTKFFFLLSTWVVELFSTPKVITLLPKPKFGNKNSERPSNQISNPE